MILQSDWWCNQNKQDQRNTKWVQPGLAKILAHLAKKEQRKNT